MFVRNFIRRKSTCANDEWLFEETASEAYPPMDTTKRGLTLALLVLVNQ